MDMKKEMLKGCVGDDGLYMTRTRISMHRLLNVIVVWGVLSILLTAAFAVFAYMQGQTYESLDLIAVGGNMHDGYSVAALLRIESAFCFVSGILLVVFHLTGFVWFYEHGGLKFIMISSVLIVAFTIGWNAFLLSIGLFDPVSLFDTALVVLFWVKRRQVNDELNRIDLSV